MIEKEGQKSAYGVEGDRAVLRAVRLGIIEGPFARILEGLRFGDRLIVAGQRMPAPGVSIQIENDLGPTSDIAKESASGRR